MKIKEIRQKNSEELNVTLLNFRKEALNLRFQYSSGAVQKTDRIRYVRRAIAQIKTILNARKLKLEGANA